MKWITPILLITVAPFFTSSANDDIPSEEAIANSTPCAFKAVTAKLGGHEIQITPLALPKPILTRSGFKGIKGLFIDDKKIYLTTGHGKAMAFTLPSGEALKLAFDPDFGEGGEMDIDASWTNGISVNDQGVVFTHNGRSTLRYEGGDWTPINGGSLIWRPGRDYGMFFSREGLTPYKGGKKLEVTIPTKGAEGTAVLGWVSKGIAYKAKEEGTKQFVRVVDTKGTVLFDLGDKEDSFKPDGFCYVHGVAGSPNLIVVVDSNCRKLAFFNNEGQFIGMLKAKDLGLDYPWMPAMAFAPDGSLYLGAQQKRKTQGDEKVTEAIVLRIQGLDAVN